MQTATIAKNQLWQGHIAAAQKFPGGVGAYCLSKQISSSKFYYWRSRLTQRAQSKNAITLSRFVPVEVTRTPQPENNLPNPRWLAEFIHHLKRGGGL